MTQDKRIGAVGAFLLAIVNLLAAFGAHLPSWATAQNVTALQGAAALILSGVLTVLHLIEGKSNASV